MIEAIVKIHFCDENEDMAMPLDGFGSRHTVPAKLHDCSAAAIFNRCKDKMRLLIQA